ncbi:MAG: hypothetical protein AB7F59_13130 [Bdellovibrionales bacterium]
MERMITNTASNSLTQALGALVTQQLLDLFENSFEKLRTVVIILSLWSTISVGWILGLFIIVVSLTYLITLSLGSVAIAALIMGAIFFTATSLFFLQILRKKFWIDVFKTPNVKSGVYETPTDLTLTTT